MNIVENYEFIKKSICSVKELKKGYITNFYENEMVVSSWIREKLLSNYQSGEAVFLFKKNRYLMLSNLFYIAPSNEILEEGLKYILKIHPDSLIVCDVLTKIDNTDLKILFENAGFFHYKSLMRMNRIKHYSKSDHDISNVVVAGINQMEQVFLLLQDYFDPIAEQLPDKEKLRNWIFNKNVLTYSIENNVIGFIIYEIIGSTLYLRYWFVDPDYREKRIGSKLFASFLSKGATSRRQLFWVIDSNENAIKRYKHYGFKEDGTYDLIMTNKKLKHDGKNIKNSNRYKT